MLWHNIAQQMWMTLAKGAHRQRPRHHHKCACRGSILHSMMKGGLTGADSRTMLLWSILEKSRISPRMVSSVSPLSKMVSASSLQPHNLHQPLDTSIPQANMSTTLTKSHQPLHVCNICNNWT